MKGPLRKSKSIIDPWNGSGTTTSVASRLGIASQGIDLNPVMTIVARARQYPAPNIEVITKQCQEVMLRSRRERRHTLTEDPLLQWLTPHSASTIRSIQAAIHNQHIDPGLSPMDMGCRAAEISSEISIEGAFFYTALLAVTRDLLKDFRSTNPTWIKIPKDHSKCLSPDARSIRADFVRRVAFLTQRLSIQSWPQAHLAQIETLSISELPKRQRFDASLTSPPYATRVDYVRSLLPELAVLGLSANQLETLRRKMMGTPIVKGLKNTDTEIRSETAHRTIEAIVAMGTHGAGNYYAPWLRNYFVSLQNGIEQLSSALTRSAVLAILVQDSHIRSQHIDLQTISTELILDQGFNQVQRHDYPVRHLMSNMNSAARAHLYDRENYESLLVFQR